ncbi:UNVERIFIED_CONTAM: hypothetical protein NCL1_29549 [Trichonephila clavipes]
MSGRIFGPFHRIDKESPWCKFQELAFCCNLFYPGSKGTGFRLQNFIIDYGTGVFIATFQLECCLKNLKSLFPVAAADPSCGEADIISQDSEVQN